jgi:hypothetical protein
VALQQGWASRIGELRVYGNWRPLGASEAGERALVGRAAPKQGDVRPRGRSSDQCGVRARLADSAGAPRRRGRSERPSGRGIPSRGATVLPDSGCLPGRARVVLRSMAGRRLPRASRLIRTVDLGRVTGPWPQQRPDGTESRTCCGACRGLWDTRAREDEDQTRTAAR